MDPRLAASILAVLQAHGAQAQPPQTQQAQPAQQPAGLLGTADNPPADIPGRMEWYRRQGAPYLSPEQEAANRAAIVRSGGDPDAPPSPGTNAAPGSINSYDPFYSLPAADQIRHYQQMGIPIPARLRGAGK